MNDTIIDMQALTAYRGHLLDLDAEIDRAAKDSDRGRVEHISNEREEILAEIRRATGLGGQPRAGANDVAERARKSVSARIRDAVLLQRVRGDRAGLDGSEGRAPAWVVPIDRARPEPPVVVLHSPNRVLAGDLYRGALSGGVHPPYVGCSNCAGSHKDGELVRGGRSNWLTDHGGGMEPPSDPARDNRGHEDTLIYASRHAHMWLIASFTWATKGVAHEPIGFRRRGDHLSAPSSEELS